MAEDDKIKIDKFDGHDFGFWKMQIEDYLYQKKLHEPLMKEGASVVNHVHEFNLILSRLISIDIKFDDEVQALLLLSSLPESWSGIVTAVRGSTKTTKLKFDNIRDLILGEDIPSKDKEVHMAVRDYDDALVCCVKNTIDDRIVYDGVSFHATYCKEYWTLKDVRYIPCLKKRLIFVGQLDEKGYHVGFGDQQWKVTKGSLVVARGNKCGSLYMVEVPSNRINAAIDGKGNAALWHQRLGHMSEKGMIPYLQKAVVGFCEPCVLGKQKKVDPATMLPLSMTTARRMNRTLNERAKSMRLHAGLPKMFWEDSVTTAAYLINRGPSVKDVARDKLDAKYMKCTFIGYGSDEMGYHFWDSKGHKECAIESRRNKEGKEDMEERQRTGRLAECKASASNEDSLGAKHQRAVKDLLSAKPQRAPQMYSSQIHRQGSRRLLEDILVSWDGYQLYGRDVSKNGCALNAVVLSPQDS
ncbi:hypothetical protein Tco_0250402 [Tanacetum coccineum]